MNRNEAWGLPPGSIRALLAVILTLAVIAGAFWRIPSEYYTALVGLAMSAITYYFASKTTKTG